MKFVLVLNPDAGTLRGLDPEAAAERLAAIFRAQGHAVRTEIHRGAAVIEAIRRICAEGDSEGIIVGGGDGTVSAAAAAAAAGRMVLGVLPLGTMNLFARAAGIPLDLDLAAQALATGRVGFVDISEVNGHPFVHHLTLGLHPRMIRIRERMSYASRLGKIWANIQSLLIAIRQPPRLRLILRLDGTTVHRRTAVLLVTNNLLGEGHMPYPDDLRGGTLGVYVSTSLSWMGLLKLTAALTLGDVSRSPQLESWSARELEVQTPREVITASVDGEIVSLERPLKVRLHHQRLQILQPSSRAEPGAFTNVNSAKEAHSMNESLNKTEARQGDRRRMNATVVFIGLPLAFVLLAILAWAFAS